MNSHGESMQLEFGLYDPGTEAVVDYEKYGSFKGLGTDQYEYKVTNRKGLWAKAPIRIIRYTRIRPTACW
jgi:hypothetical protein